MAKSSAQTGVILDNTYTAKAAFGLKDLMQNKPEVFKGKRILFLHTGSWRFFLICEFENEKKN